MGDQLCPKSCCRFAIYMLLCERRVEPERVLSSDRGRGGWHVACAAPAVQGEALGGAVMNTHFPLEKMLLSTVK